MSTKILDPSVQAPLVAPFRVMMTVSPGAQSLFFARSRQGAYAVAPIWLKNSASVDITEFVTGITWSAGEDNNYTTLGVTLDNYRGMFNQIPLGTRIRLQIRRPFRNYQGKKEGKWYDYISAFTFEKSRDGSADSQTMQLQCYDRLYWVSQNDLKGRVYKSDKKKPNGWTATQIIRDIAAELKLPVGKIDASSKALKRFETKGKALDNIKKVLQQDNKATGRKNNYVVHMRDGKLNVVLEDLNPKTAYEFNDQNSIETGSLNEVLGQNFATRITVTGNKKGKAKTAGGTSVSKIEPNKVTLNPTNPAYQQAFGIIHKNIKLKGSQSAGEFARLAKNQLDKAVAPERTFNVTTRGVPHLWPGSRVLVISGYFGVNGLVKVKSVDYSVSGTEFTLNLSLAADKKTFMTDEQAKLYYRKMDIRY